MIFEVALSVYDAVICLLNAVNSPYIASAFNMTDSYFFVILLKRT